MSDIGSKRLLVIPLSVQKERDHYTVGSVDLGEFYQFPEQGLQILNMLRSGDTPNTIKFRLMADDGETVDVDSFIDQLLSIGLIYPEDQKKLVDGRLQALAAVTRRSFNVNPRIAKAVFSLQTLVFYLCTIGYAAVSAIQTPELRINPGSLYTDKNRTLLLLAIILFSLIRVTMHELGHMLAAAKFGIRSRYGLGTRLWNIVAETDITGILALPKSQRYLPMLAGMLVDILSMSLVTILIGILLRYEANPFAIQIAQALVLETALSLTWQLNVFVKTDIYYVLCNYFSCPDLDRDARVYLLDLLYRVSFGLIDIRVNMPLSAHMRVVRIFSLIWFLGRLLSICILLGVFLPAIVQYVKSAVELLRQPSASYWAVCDTMMYVSITLMLLATGMYMWLKQR